MIFNSIEFLLLFLPIFFILYGLTPDKYKNVVLLLGSLVFYTLGDARYLPVLLLSLAVNYGIGRNLRVRKQVKGKKKSHSYIHARRWLLLLAVAGNVGGLLLFKGGIPGGSLPLGMSFYTFQILSYLIDVYRGDIPREVSFVRFVAYVAMFPRLISGPIVSYGEVEPAMKRRKFTAAGVQSGLQLFAVGLGVKVLLADRVGLLWHEVQVTGFESISTPLAWLAAIAYSLKLYFDFYGYSLMAVGLGKMLGFLLPENFREPYMALSVRDFYRRWHITLGRWFCRYVYIPLGGSRQGELRTALNLLAVWLLTGVWHGYTGNFLLWALVLWLLIVLERQVGRMTGKRAAGPERRGERWRLLRHLYLWAVIPVTWMCFAITDMGELGTYLGRMFGVIPRAVVSAGDWRRALQHYGVLLLVAGAACLPVWKKWYRRWQDSLPVKILLAAVFWICVWRIVRDGYNPFMYRTF